MPFISVWNCVQQTSALPIRLIMLKSPWYTYIPLCGECVCLASLCNTSRSAIFVGYSGCGFSSFCIVTVQVSSGVYNLRGITEKRSFWWTTCTITKHKLYICGNKLLRRYLDVREIDFVCGFICVVSEIISNKLDLSRNSADGSKDLGKILDQQYSQDCQ
jgi:hypothetical protein